jgi:hypothetical protein
MEAAVQCITLIYENDMIGAWFSLCFTGDGYLNVAEVNVPQHQVESMQNEQEEEALKIVKVLFCLWFGYIMLVIYYVMLCRALKSVQSLSRMQDPYCHCY